MATIILRPNSNVQKVNWTGSYTDVDEVTSDEDGSYAYLNTNEDRDSRQFLIKENGVTTESGSGAPLFSYQTSSKTWTTRPSDGQPFTVADIDDLAVGEGGQTASGIPAKILFGLPASGINGIINSVKLWRRDRKQDAGYPNVQIRLTQMWVEVDYTPVVAPTVTTQAADSIEENTANPKGNVTDTGWENPTRYIDYDTDSGEPYTHEKNCGTGGTGVYNSNLTGLSPGQKYYYRARVVNSAGEDKGSEMSFTTKPNPPTNLVATVV